MPSAWRSRCPAARSASAGEALPEPARAGAPFRGGPSGARGARKRGIALGDAGAFADAACCPHRLRRRASRRRETTVLSARWPLSTAWRPAWLTAARIEAQRHRLRRRGAPPDCDLARDFVLETPDGRFAEPVARLLTAGSDEDAGSARADSARHGRDVRRGHVVWHPPPDAAPPKPERYSAIAKTASR